MEVTNDVDKSSFDHLEVVVLKHLLFMVVPGHRCTPEVPIGRLSAR